MTTKLRSSEGARPEVTVVIPTFGRPKIVENAVRSAARQSVRPAAIIVVDNHPSGNAEPTMATIGQTEPVPIIYRHAADVDSVSYARNIGWQLATTPLVAFLDDDDQWAPEHLELVTERLRATSAEACLAGIEQVDPRGCTRPGKVPAEGLPWTRFYARNPGVTGSNLTISFDALQELQGFDETLDASEDKDLIIRLLQSGRRYTVATRPTVKQQIGLNDHLSSPGNARQRNGLVRFAQKHGPTAPFWARLLFRGKIHESTAHQSRTPIARTIHTIASLALLNGASWRRLTRRPGRRSA